MLGDGGHLHEAVVDERALRHEKEADELQRTEGVPNKNDNNNNTHVNTKVNNNDHTTNTT